jgi:hypothetical protein
MIVIVSGYDRTRASDAVSVIVLIKESVSHAPRNRLFFHLGAQIDGNATNSWFYWQIAIWSGFVAESFGSHSDGMQLADGTRREGTNA